MQDGQDKAFKDVIEPLESVSLGIAPTTRASLADAGTPQEVGASLVAKSAAPGTKVALVSATQRTDAAGVTYYAFEFTSAARGVTRHAITTLAVANGAGAACGRGVRGGGTGADAAVASCARAACTPRSRRAPLLPPAGKVYTLTGGASQARWGKMAERLKTVSESFTLLGY